MINLKVKEILAERNKSIYWLANETSLAYPTLYRIANQQTDGIQFHTLEEIMKALNIEDFNQIMDLIPDED